MMKVRTIWDGIWMLFQFLAMVSVIYLAFETLNDLRLKAAS